tara:strand:+ start:683 stop:865 length:183 start_codon:yes stop_codon:yes gene_type:complete
MGYPTDDFSTAAGATSKQNAMFFFIIVVVVAVIFGFFSFLNWMSSASLPDSPSSETDKKK